jgi:lipopolysaccharide heptosyltransferase II
MMGDGMHRIAPAAEPLRATGADAPRPPFSRPPVPPTPGLLARVRLAGLRIVGRTYRKTPRASVEPRSALLIRPDHMGDLLFATPAFHLLRAALPAARVTLLVGPWSRAVVVGNPDLDAVRICRFPGFERQPKTSLVAPYRLLVAMARELRNQFDIAVVLRFDHWWGAWLAAAAGIPRRIGYDRPETRPFLTDALPYQTGRHEVEQNAALVAAVATGAVGRAGPLRYAVSGSAQAWVVDWLQAHQADGDRPLVAIHPGAGAPVKQWPVSAWAEVAAALTRDHRARIVLTGSAAEQPLTAAIAAALPEPPLDVSGLTNLDQLAALLARCALALGSDSGPLHLAVAVGTPTVHLYGPVDPARFGPWGDPARHAVLASRWPCAPCNRLAWASPAEHACMGAIAPDDVVGAAHSVLSGG